jgi:hypothetical protein
MCGSQIFLNKWYLARRYKLLHEYVHLNTNKNKTTKENKNKVPVTLGVLHNLYDFL